MKFLHTSDWHLGRSDGDTSLLEDQSFFIDEICRVVKEQNIDAVMLAGDVYDRALASADAVKLYDNAMTRLCVDHGVSVFVIAGNHDSAERLSACGAILRRSGLYVCGELTADPAPVEMGEAEVFLLPWITAEKVRSVFPEREEQVTDLANAYRVAVDAMRERFTPGKRHILLAHAFITNAETSDSDRTAEIGFASQIPASVFEGFDYVALGHLHGPQKVNDHIRYSGTPMPYSFGKEEAQTKGVVIFDTQTAEQEFVPLPLLHERHTIECPLEEALHPSWSAEVLNGYVRLRILDAYIGLQTLSDLRSLYQNLVYTEGKSFEQEGSSVTMTMEELEEMETDPEAVFRYFCREEMGEEPDEHRLGLFRDAVNKTEQEGLL